MKRSQGSVIKYGSKYLREPDIGLGRLSEAGAYIIRACIRADFVEHTNFLCVM